MVNPKQEDTLLIPDNLEQCQAELIESRRETEELKDRFLRAAAQIENIRKWTERDVLARSKEDQRRLLRQFLEVVDNLERALARPAEPDALAQGVQLTLKQFKKVLAQAGVERMQVEPGDLFDPAYHQGVEARQDEVDEPTIAEIVQPGYLYENDLLRPASVIVLRPVD
ncbi:MAG TPA: nucleotide exchange factor GrpE [Anaerolineales bacterium]